MAKLFGGEKFDTRNEEEMESFDALPPGDYVCRIKKSEMKENKNKNGHYLSLQFEVSEGKKKGRILFSNLNLDHPNSDAVAMARKELTSIVKACGKTSVEDSEELHGIDIVCKVVKKAATANYPEGNEIKGYKAYDESGSGSEGDSESSGKKEESAPKKKKVSFD